MRQRGHGQYIRPSERHRNTEHVYGWRSVDPGDRDISHCTSRCDSRGISDANDYYEHCRSAYQELIQMQKFWKDRQASTIVEMTLVGIPLIFILISTFDIALGMWGYDTLAYGVRETTRYATVHGQDCTTSPNSCGITVSSLAHYFGNAAIGVPSGTVNVSFVSLKDSITCNPLSSCFSNTNTFPSANANGTGDPITVTATYPFKTAIAIFWPGSAPVQFGTVTFYASSTDNIQF